MKGARRWAAALGWLGAAGSLGGCASSGVEPLPDEPLVTLPGNHLLLSASPGQVRADTLEISLQAWGRGAGLPPGEARAIPCDAAQPDPGPRRGCVTAWAWPGLIEWWEPRFSGMEQLWQVTDAPAGTGPLVLSIGVNGEVSQAGHGLRIVEPGRTWTVGAPRAHDTTGRVLPAEILADLHGYRVVVDDTDAVYPVSIDPPFVAAAATWTAPSPDSELGRALLLADLDADGFSEVILGAPGHSSQAGLSQAGAVFVYPGSSAGPASTPSLVLESPFGASRFGGALGTGDVNGDGFADLLVGALKADDGAGGVAVYLGSALGLSSTPQRTLLGAASNDAFGTMVDANGDADGDGFAELAVGVEGYATWTGKVQVYPGTALGSSDVAVFDVEGDVERARLGEAIAWAGDTDGDGYDDLLTSGCGRTTGSRLYRGGPGGLTTAFDVLDQPDADGAYNCVVAAGDLDADGRGDLAISFLEAGDGAGRVMVRIADGTWITLRGAERGQTWGQGLAVGDIDADGYGDLVVGAPGAVASGSRVELMAGGPLGPNLRALILPGLPETGFGGAVAAGDVNGDGFDDILVSTEPDTTAGGEVTLYYGFDGDRDDDGGWSSAWGGPDCDDDDPELGPLAVEIPADGVDSDCDGMELCYRDYDGDGHRSLDGATLPSANFACDGPGEGHPLLPADDCDDLDPASYPGHPENCGGGDNDCDGENDEADAIDVVRWGRDNDGDSYGDPADSRDQCEPPDGYVRLDKGLDCNDRNAGVHPGLRDVPADGIDQDCNGEDYGGEPGKGTYTGGCGGGAALLLLGLLPWSRRRSASR